jgi:uncharacterized membrane protein
MATLARVRSLSWRRALGTLLALAALVAAIAMLVVIMQDPAQLLAWLALSSLILAAGYGAHLARRRRA